MVKEQYIIQYGYIKKNVQCLQEKNTCIEHKEKPNSDEAPAFPVASMCCRV